MYTEDVQDGGHYISHNPSDASFSKPRRSWKLVKWETEGRDRATDNLGSGTQGEDSGDKEKVETGGKN